MSNSKFPEKLQSAINEALREGVPPELIIGRMELVKVDLCNGILMRSHLAAQAKTVENILCPEDNHTETN